MPPLLTTSNCTISDTASLPRDIQEKRCEHPTVINCMYSHGQRAVFALDMQINSCTRGSTDIYLGDDNEDDDLPPEYYSQNQDSPPTAPSKPHNVMALAVIQAKLARSCGGKKSVDMFCQGYTYVSTGDFGRQWPSMFISPTADYQAKGSRKMILLGSSFLSRSVFPKIIGNIYVGVTHCVMKGQSSNDPFGPMFMQLPMRIPWADNFKLVKIEEIILAQVRQRQLRKTSSCNLSTSVELMGHLGPSSSSSWGRAEERLVSISQVQLGIPHVLLASHHRHLLRTKTCLIVPLCPTGIFQQSTSKLFQPRRPPSTNPCDQTTLNIDQRLSTFLSPSKGGCCILPCPASTSCPLPWPALDIITGPTGGCCILPCPASTSCPLPWPALDIITGPTGVLSWLCAPIDQRPVLYLGLPWTSSLDPQVAVVSCLVLPQRPVLYPGLPWTSSLDPQVAVVSCLVLPQRPVLYPGLPWTSSLDPQVAVVILPCPASTSCPLPWPALDIITGPTGGCCILLLLTQRPVLYPPALDIITGPKVAVVSCLVLPQRPCPLPWPALDIITGPTGVLLYLAVCLLTKVLSLPGLLWTSSGPTGGCCILPCPASTSCPLPWPALDIITGPTGVLLYLPVLLLPQRPVLYPWTCPQDIITGLQVAVVLQGNTFCLQSCPTPGQLCSPDIITGPDRWLSLLPCLPQVLSQSPALLTGPQVQLLYPALSCSQNVTGPLALACFLTSSLDPQVAIVSATQSSSSPVTEFYPPALDIIDCDPQVAPASVLPTSCPLQSWPAQDILSGLQSFYSRTFSDVQSSTPALDIITLRLLSLSAPVTQRPSQ